MSLSRDMVIVHFILFLTLFFTSSSYAQNAYLDIYSKPDAVTIYINGSLMGKTPITGIRVPAGSVLIKAEKEGYGSATQTITVFNNDLKVINISLKPTEEVRGETHKAVNIEQDKGNLLVVNQLGNIPVYIDKSNRGNGSVKINNLAAGSRTLQVGPFSKLIKIYKDYDLVVVVSKSGIKIENDIEEMAEREAKEKRRIEEEYRKNEEEQAKVEKERIKNAKILEEKAKREAKLNELRNLEKLPIQHIDSDLDGKSKSFVKNNTKFELTFFDWRTAAGSEKKDYNIVAYRDICKYKFDTKMDCTPVRIEMRVDSAWITGLWGIGNKVYNSTYVKVYFGSQLKEETKYEFSMSPGNKKSFTVTDHGVKLQINIHSNYTHSWFTAERLDDNLPGN